MVDDSILSCLSNDDTTPPPEARGHGRRGGRMIATARGTDVEIASLGNHRGATPKTSTSRTPMGMLMWIGGGLRVGGRSWGINPTLRTTGN